MTDPYRIQGQQEKYIDSKPVAKTKSIYLDGLLMLYGVLVCMYSGISVSGFINGNNTTGIIYLFVIACWAGAAYFRIKTLKLQAETRKLLALTADLKKTSEKI